MTTLWPLIIHNKIYLPVHALHQPSRYPRPNPEKLHLVNFQYAGGTDSITYKYLWSPIDEYLLKFVPLSIAPNLITLFAFSILLFSHIVFMLPDNGPIPAWKLIMMAVSIILYQHLDNIDGKQARRTSTPLIT